MARTVRSLIPLLALADAASPALAQLPPGIYAGERSIKDASARTYVLDPTIRP